MTETVETVPSSGTMVSANKPNSSYYYTTKLASWISPLTTYQTFFYTPMPTQLATRTVLSATLVVNMKPGTGANRTISVIRHDKLETPGYPGIVYNNKPGFLPNDSSTTVTQNPALTEWRFDVTGDVQNIKSGGEFYGWRITSSYASAWEMEGWQSSQAPRLIVEMAVESTDPTDLRPDGVTALAKPTLTWTTPDGMLFAQAQIDTVGDNFTIPLYDTGSVATTEAEFDLSRTNLPGGIYAGIADGTSVIARVRHTTSAGVSAWSDTITMTRQSYATLSITGPSDPTHDPTPTVSWSFPGQTHYQVTTTTDGKTIANLGPVPGTATAYTPPVGATRTGQDLTFRVRTWDAADRTASPGDAGFVSQILTVTYRRGLGAAVTSLTANQDGVKPWVDLDWTRSAGVPDEYMIVRDDDIIARFPGTSGGNPVWDYRDYTCPPNIEVVYEVVPMTANVAAVPGPQVPFQADVTGTWLFDPEDETHFSLGGEANGPGYVESSVVYAGVGSAVAVKRTFGMRGLEGQVQGLLDDYDDRTMSEQLADLFIIKSRPTRTFRYVAGDLNVPVVVFEISPVTDTDQTVGDRIVKQVSYSLLQDGELPFPEIQP